MSEIEIYIIRVLSFFKHVAQENQRFRSRGTVR